MTEEKKSISRVYSTLGSLLAVCQLFQTRTIFDNWLSLVFFSFFSTLQIPKQN